MSCNVVVAAPQGGVGRTTIVAQLALRISALGKRCLAMDFDPQNSLGLRLGEEPIAWVQRSTAAGRGNRIPLSAVGLVHPQLSQSVLAEQARVRGGRVSHVAFGVHSCAERWQMEADMLVEFGGFRARVAELTPPKCDVVLIDTPAGQNIWAEAALGLADVVLVPLLARASTAALLPGYEQYLQEVAPDLPADRTFYVISQWDPTRALSHDVLELLRSVRAPQMVAHPIFYDEALEESFARGHATSLDDAFQVAADFDMLAKFLVEATSVHERRAASA